MAHFSESIFIQRPPEAVWREIQTSHDHNRTHREEMVDARVTQSTPPSRLEEHQEGRTFSRRLRYRLRPAPGGTSVRVEDEVTFKGLGRLLAPIASYDIRKHWGTSLVQLKAGLEGG
jgi:hypothetical protein